MGHLRVAPMLSVKAKLTLKNITISYANKIHFHLKGFALTLVLKARVFVTPKWLLLGKRR